MPQMTLPTPLDPDASERTPDGGDAAGRALPARAWLVVMPREEADAALRLASVGVDHLHRSQLSKMNPGDGVVCYSPPHRLLGGGLEPRGFSAVGTVVDAPPFVATDDGGHDENLAPYRRDITIVGTTFVRLDDVALQLNLTRDTRRVPAANSGVTPLAVEDFALLRDLMVAVH